MTVETERHKTPKPARENMQKYAQDLTTGSAHWIGGMGGTTGGGGGTIMPTTLTAGVTSNYMPTLVNASPATSYNAAMLVNANR